MVHLVGFYYKNIFINLYKFWATMCPSSGETTVYMQYFVLVILYGWLSGMQGEMKTLYTRQSSTQNNKYQVSHKYSCFSWWWANSRPKHVEIGKYTKSKLCTRLALFTRLCRDAWSPKHKILQDKAATMKLHEMLHVKNGTHWRRRCKVPGVILFHRGREGPSSVRYFHRWNWLGGSEENQLGVTSIC